MTSKTEEELREEIITFLIESRTPNPRAIKYVDRWLFEIDNQRQIEEMVQFYGTPGGV